MAKLLSSEINGDLTVYNNIETEGSVTLHTPETTGIKGVHPVDGYPKDMLNMSVYGNTTVGYGNYADETGDTDIYGENVKFYTKGTTVTTNGVPFGIHALTVGCSQELALTSTKQKVICDNVHSNGNEVSTGILEAYDGGIRVSRKGRYLVSGSAHVVNTTAGSALEMAVYTNEDATAEVLAQTGAGTAVTAVQPLKVLSVNEGTVFYLYASAPTGSIQADNKTILTVMAID